MHFALLIAAFGLTALLYASVGFGGGSTYTALLLLSGVGVAHVPFISLTCNIAVVGGGSALYARAQLTPWQTGWPLLLFAAPAAFVGGQTPITEGLLVQLLAWSLLASATAMLVQPRAAATASFSSVQRAGITAMAIGLGYLAGLVGIGGGIFLAPILNLLRWDTPRRIAATASLFILINSLFGLAGQVAKRGIGDAIALGHEYWPLLIAVAIGGAIGSRIGISALAERVQLINRLTAVLVAAVAIRLLITG